VLPVGVLRMRPSDCAGVRQARARERGARRTTASVRCCPSTKTSTVVRCATAPRCSASSFMTSQSAPHQSVTSAPRRMYVTYHRRGQAYRLGRGRCRRGEDARAVRTCPRTRCAALQDSRLCLCARVRAIVFRAYRETGHTEGEEEAQRAEREREHRRNRAGAEERGRVQDRPVPAEREDEVDGRRARACAVPPHENVARASRTRSRTGRPGIPGAERVVRRLAEDAHARVRRADVPACALSRRASRGERRTNSVMRAQAGSTSGVCFRTTRSEPIGPLRAWLSFGRRASGGCGWARESGRTWRARGCSAGDDAYETFQ
jgi:hypothetical protein